MQSGSREAAGAAPSTAPAVGRGDAVGGDVSAGETDMADGVAVDCVVAIDCVVADGVDVPTVAGGATVGGDPAGAGAAGASTGGGVWAVGADRDCSTVGGGAGCEDRGFSTSRYPVMASATAITTTAILNSQVEMTSRRASIDPSAHGQLRPASSIRHVAVPPTA